MLDSRRSMRGSRPTAKLPRNFHARGVLGGDVALNVARSGAAPGLLLRYCNIATAPKETGDGPGCNLRITIKRYANTGELR